MCNGNFRTDSNKCPFGCNGYVTRNGRGRWPKATALFRVPASFKAVKFIKGSKMDLRQATGFCSLKMVLEPYPSSAPSFYSRELRGPGAYLKNATNTRYDTLYYNTCTVRVPYSTRTALWFNTAREITKRQFQDSK
jgi:hypothetical protein